MSYANIRVMNTTLGTAANTEGYFKLKLKPGEYNLITSYIGYYSDTISVKLDKNLTEINFSLEQTKLTLEDIIIKPGENPALEIIRKAINKKKERNLKLNTYEFEAYTKGIIRTAEDFSAKGSDVVIGFSTSDSTDLEITGILENQSKGYFQKPANYCEIILARKQSTNFPPTLNMLTGGRIIQNFYDDDVYFFESDLPGPLADDALDYYYFYIEMVVAMDDRKVFQIFMAPNNSSNPGFEGNIFISDSTYDLIKVDLRLNSAANVGGVFDTINVFQQFANYDNIYMPVDYRLFIKASVLGIAELGFELNSILYHYKINPDIDEDEFTKATISVLPDADKKDSLYWFSTQSIPNTREEELAYKRIDSLNQIPISFWDRLSILSSRTDISDNFSINAPLNMYHFNTVEGHALDFGLYVDDYSDRRMNSSIELSYGFSDNKIKTDLYFVYLLSDYRTYRITLNAYNKLKILGGTSISYWNLTATLLALLNKEEFRDYYYSKGFDIQFAGQFLPFLKFITGLQHHTDLSAQNNSDFSFFKKDKSYRENPNILDTKLNALTAGFKLDFRDYIEDGYFRSRSSFGHSYIIFSGNITHSSTNFLNSDLNFTTYKFRIRSYIRTFRSAHFNFRIFGMYNTGVLPIQELYALSGNINIITKNNTFRTLRVNEVFGERILTFNIEHNFRNEFFKIFNIPGLKDWDITVKTFFNIAYSEIGPQSMEVLPLEVNTFPHPFYEIGFGLGQGVIPIQLEFSWKLNYKGNNNFVIGLNTFLF
jgi:hypothetical protein